MVAHRCIGLLLLRIISNNFGVCATCISGASFPLYCKSYFKLNPVIRRELRPPKFSHIAVYQLYIFPSRDLLTDLYANQGQPSTKLFVDTRNNTPMTPRAMESVRNVGLQTIPEAKPNSASNTVQHPPPLEVLPPTFLSLSWRD